MNDDHRWRGEALDLRAYLSRTGADAPARPDVAALHALHRAHVLNIPFENLEIVLGRPIVLDVEALQDKMVRRRRGGYCYEHASLFAAALERLGYGVSGISGRVSMGAPGLRPATHALLRVTTDEDERVWICDVGFGTSPLTPVELRDGAEAARDGRRLRLARGEDPAGAPLWTMHEQNRDGWVDNYTFTPNPQYRVDWTVGNHYVSTSPHSPFTARPIAHRRLTDEDRRLSGTTLTITHPDGSAQRRELTTAERPEVLAEQFGIVLDAEDAKRLAG
ncbi:arylamine N-acetyltransferase family protein [Actinomadura flavalba]|uniref:arylamine N-acetyltransferase family protein n=1 Tax=Actinomadura flavalba TaxID=1120938 RepID=UPI00036E44BB|nr:arylamine N-acetyltransferase [Actinomadura flavalba]